jgi:peptide/nickel transport system ATP-binding protein
MSGLSAPLLEVRELRVHFPLRRGLFGGARGRVHAVDGVSFSIAEGETLGLVGESGCGKTTLGRALLRLVEPTAGSVRFAGRDVLAAGRAELKALRRSMQIVFQDPWSSLNPRMTAGSIVAEGLEIHRLARGSGKTRRVAELLEQVGLPADAAQRHPHEFSGGQRQRIGIARALAVGPRFVVCDEAVSALDLSVQAQVVNLLLELRERHGLSYLFISHDLAVVRAVSHRVAVMHLGEIVEVGPADEVLARPRHPYTQALLAAVPRAIRDGEPPRLLVEGEPPSPIEPPPGCRFHPRCPLARAECRAALPPTRTAGPGHEYRCVLEDASLPGS